MRRLRANPQAGYSVDAGFAGTAADAVQTRLRGAQCRTQLASIICAVARG
jgi:hypothetical protein